MGGASPLPIQISFKRVKEYFSLFNIFSCVFFSESFAHFQGSVFPANQEAEHTAPHNGGKKGVRDFKQLAQFSN
jgi:hypothetical protein